jgi:hypothetical protein
VYDVLDLLNQCFYRQIQDPDLVNKFLFYSNIANSFQPLGSS